MALERNLYKVIEKIMYTVLLVIHTIIVLFLIGIILLQRSESDGLSGLGGGGGNVLSGRGAANAMTRATAILATIFIITSLALAILSGQDTRGSIVDAITEEAAREPKAQEVPKPDATEAPAAAPAKPKAAKQKPAVEEEETTDVPQPE